MDHRIKAEGQDIPAAAEESPEGEAPELEHTGGRFLPGTTGSAKVAYDHIARYRVAKLNVKGKKTMVDPGRGAGGYGTYALPEEVVAYDSWFGGGHWPRS